MNYHPHQGGMPHGAPGPYAPPPGYRQPGPNLHLRPIRRNANILAAGLILVDILMSGCYLMLQELFSLLLPANILVDLHSLLYQFSALLSYCVGFIVPIILLVAWIGIPGEVAFPMRRLNPSLAVPAVFFCLGLNIVGAYISMAIGAGLQVLFGVSPVSPEYAMPHGAAPTLLYIISIAIAPAILEEMLFRGVIMQSLRRYGDGFALVVSAVLFSFCHGNLVQGPPTLLIGLAIGYLVLRTGSLLIGILIHFVNNGLAVLLEFLFYYGSENVQIGANLLFFVVYIGGGIIGLVFLMTSHPHMFRVMPSRYPVAERQKYMAFFVAVVPILYILLTIYYTIRYLS